MVASRCRWPATASTTGRCGGHLTPEPRCAAGERTGPPAMKRSTEPILTAHVGSLARADALVPTLKAKGRGQSYDRDAYARLVSGAVADVVRRQTEAGVDV